MANSQKKLTASTRSLFYFLRSKQRYFKSKHKLSREDGSFFYDDKRLAAELGCSDQTIRRAKRVLQAEGFIRIEIGIHTGRATKYWILKEPIKMSSCGHSENLSNCLSEGIKIIGRAYQNVSPIKVINKENNKGHLCLPIAYFEEVFNSSRKDKDHTKRILLDQNYTEYQIEEAFGKYHEGLKKQAMQS